MLQEHSLIWIPHTLPLSMHFLTTWCVFCLAKIHLCLLLQAYNTGKQTCHTQNNIIRSEMGAVFKCGFKLVHVGIKIVTIQSYAWLRIVKPVCILIWGIWWQGKTWGLYSWGSSYISRFTESLTPPKEQNELKLKIRIIHGLFSYTIINRMYTKT